jgi:CheY-like chemotaxis protein
VVLAVRDDGEGMDQETLDNLFEPFFTTKALGKGTGLGLSTVYGIVRQNKGFIMVDSKKGRGTVFSIYFPAHGRNLPEQDAMAQSSLPQARGHETVLLVEDEPAILKMTMLILEKLGYTVLTAPTPREALERFRKGSGPVDLLITDVIMPDMNGKDLADRLSNTFPNLSILFMSGYTADVIAHHGVLDEHVAFIQKPFSRKDLATKIREVLDSRRNRG